MASFSKKYQKEEKSEDSDDGFNFDDDDVTENSGSSSQVNVKPVSSLLGAEKNVSNVKLDVDAIINKLLSLTVRNIGLQPSDLPEDQILALIDKAKDLVTMQPVFLQLKAPVKIVSDIHGQYKDLLRFLDLAKHPPHSNYLFLGDYVDRGKQSIESICLLFAYKIKYPESVFLLRGNHEDENITKIYGFYEECQRRYNIAAGRIELEVDVLLAILALQVQQLHHQFVGVASMDLALQEDDAILQQQVAQGKLTLPLDALI